MKTLVMIFVLMLMPTLAQAGEVNAVAYLQQTTLRYEQALQRCMEIQRQSELPESSIMAALRAYPADQVNAFLITRAAEMEDACVESELADLAIALHLLANEAEADEELSLVKRQTRSAVFSQARWGLKKRYLSLPSDMKADLESYDVFQAPFNSLLIREYLELERGVGIQ